MTCVICKGEIEPHKNAEGVVYWTEGHNAEPVIKNGRCCDRCSDIVVIPTRMGIASRRAWSKRFREISG